MPAARFAVVPGGHAPWDDNANAVADLITAFITETPRPSQLTPESSPAHAAPQRDR